MSKKFSKYVQKILKVLYSARKMPPRNADFSEFHFQNDDRRMTAWNNWHLSLSKLTSLSSGKVHYFTAVSVL